MDAEPVQTSDELARERTDLAASRTLMAADRTLMAWVRTALSMISFGFAIYKLLEGLQKSGDLLPDPNTPRTVGLFLTGLGTASILMGTIEYSQRLRQLRTLGNSRLWTPSFVIAVIISLTGAVLFVSIIRRLA
jgi:putative membrane protein